MKNKNKNSKKNNNYSRVLEEFKGKDVKLLRWRTKKNN